MFKFAKVLFIVAGVFIILFGCVGLSISDNDAFFVLSLFIIIIGFALICLSIAISKVSKVEDKIAKYRFLFGDSSENQIPLMKCDKCGRRFEADVDECPYCEVKRVKRAYVRVFNEEDK